MECWKFRSPLGSLVKLMLVTILQIIGSILPADGVSPERPLVFPGVLPHYARRSASRASPNPFRFREVPNRWTPRI